ncbi:hypothetical protein THAOC_16656, partial [Thalassiosira oceanica]
AVGAQATKQRESRLKSASVEVTPKPPTAELIVVAIMAVPNLDTNEDDAAEPPSDLLPDNTEDKLLKKKILLDTILDKLRGSNDEVLKQLSQAIDSGDNLNADVLSGGYTNYSYKVYVEGNPDLCIFAKVCPESYLRTLS